MIHVIAKSTLEIFQILYTTKLMFMLKMSIQAHSSSSEFLVIEMNFIIFFIVNVTTFTKLLTNYYSQQMIDITAFRFTSGSLRGRRPPSFETNKDSSSYKEEFYNDSDKQDLVQKQERQVNGIVAGQWHHRQRQEEEEQREDVPQPPAPPPPPPPPPPPSIKRDPPTFYIPPPPTEPPPPIPTSVTPPFSIGIPLTNGNPPVSNGVPNGVSSPTELTKVKFQL